MSREHWQGLEAALGRRGWRIVAVHAGDGYAISASWEIQRSSRRPSLFIDFDGLDDMTCLPLEQSYACHVRGSSPRDGASSLYFRPPNKSRALWEKDLAAFVANLDRLDGDVMREGTA